jgi:hypothetical protein
MVFGWLSRLLRNHIAAVHSILELDLTSTLGLFELELSAALPRLSGASSLLYRHIEPKRNQTSHLDLNFLKYSPPT